MEKIEEYNALRAEFLQRDNQFDNYRKIAYTATTAVLAFSLSQEEPLISLIPIVMIIPLYIISEDTIRGMSKIGAYIRVFYNDDGFCWEKRNMSYGDRLRGKKRTWDAFSNNALIYLALVLICGSLSLFKTYIGYVSAIGNRRKYYEQLFPDYLINLRHAMLIRIAFVAIAVIASVLIIIRKKVYQDDERKRCVEVWNAIKENEKQFAKQGTSLL